MKKQLTTLFLLLVCTVSVNITAQNLNDIMEKLSKSENAIHQIVDKEMLNLQFSQGGDSATMSNLPPFIKKIDGMDVIIIEKASDSDTALLNELSNFSGGDKYESLTRIKDGDSDVHIIAEKNIENNNTSNIYIIVMDEATLVMVKMTGELSKSDIEDIVKEQTKDIGKNGN